MRLYLFEDSSDDADESLFSVVVGISETVDLVISADVCSWGCLISNDDNDGISRRIFASPIFCRSSGNFKLNQNKQKIDL